MDAAKNQALIDIQGTLERDTPPEALYVEPMFGNGWLYVDGTWIEADWETYDLFLLPWSWAGRAKWGEFVKRVDLPSVTDVPPELRAKLLERSRATA